MTPDDSTRGLYGPYVVSWFATVFGVVLFYAIIMGTMFANRDVLSQYAGEEFDLERMFEQGEFQSLFWRTILVLAIAALPAWILVLFARSWYAAVLLRRIAEMTALAGLQPKAAVTTPGLWWLSTGNMLISLFTLGFGAPIVLHRTARFTAERLELAGAVDGATIGQSQQAMPGRGEGLLEALDAGGAF
jgi:uncharacterized membrane protein YjgN (DUF898 family)